MGEKADQVLYSLGLPLDGVELDEMRGGHDRKKTLPRQVEKGHRTEVPKLSWFTEP